MSFPFLHLQQLPAQVQHGAREKLFLLSCPSSYLELDLQLYLRFRLMDPFQTTESTAAAFKDALKEKTMSLVAASLKVGHVSIVLLLISVTLHLGMV